MNTISTRRGPQGHRPLFPGHPGRGMALYLRSVADDAGRRHAEGIEAQTEQVFDNIDAVLAAGGARLGEVVKATVFVTDLNDFARLNAVYERRFGGHKPARSTVEVARAAARRRVEIEIIARLPRA